MKEIINLDEPEKILLSRRRFIKAGVGAAVTLACCNRPANAYFVALGRFVLQGARWVAGLIFGSYRTVAVVARVEEALVGAEAAVAAAARVAAQRAAVVARAALEKAAAAARIAAQQVGTVARAAAQRAAVAARAAADQAVATARVAAEKARQAAKRAQEEIAHFFIEESVETIICDGESTDANRAKMCGDKKLLDENSAMNYFFDEKTAMDFAFYPSLASIPFEKNFDFRGYQKSLIGIHPVGSEMSDDEYLAYRTQDKNMILSRVEDEDRFEILAKYFVDRKVRILRPDENVTTRITPRMQPIDYFSGDLIFPDMRDQHHYEELISRTGVDVFDMLSA